MKLRSMFHVIYKSASTYTTVRSADGKHTGGNRYNLPDFKCNSGGHNIYIVPPVLHHDPLELILRRYDSDSRREVTLADPHFGLR